MFFIRNFFFHKKHRIFGFSRDIRGFLSILFLGSLVRKMLESKKEADSKQKQPSKNEVHFFCIFYKNNFL